MKKKFLSLFDKILLGILVGILSLFGCSKKAYSEKKDCKKENKDTLQIDKDRIKNSEIIAMYGVRPTRELEK